MEVRGLRSCGSKFAFEKGVDFRGASDIIYTIRKEVPIAARNQFGPAERAARSRLAQILHGREVIHGSIVPMDRVCGKDGCRCTRGEKHSSLYLSAKVQGKRRMVYIPPDMEEEVRRRVEAWQEVQRLAQEVSGACLGRVLELKRRRGRKDDG